MVCDSVVVVRAVAGDAIASAQSAVSAASQAAGPLFPMRRDDAASRHGRQAMKSRLREAFVAAVAGRPQQSHRFLV
jgi:hypothetical protein